MADSKKTITRLWLIIIFLVLALALCLGALLGSRASGAVLPSVLSAKQAVDEHPSFDEVWSWGKGDTKVVRIQIRGELFRWAPSGLFGPPYDPVEAILRQIRAAQNDPAVRGLLLEVSSPGGDMTSADEIRQALIEFGQSRSDRKILSFIRDLGVSGAYYAILPSDWIISEPTALLGSIGVILQTLNWKALSEKIGVTDTTIKSGPHKDLLNPFREPPKEQLALLQEIVDSSYQRFFDAVVEHRQVDADQLKRIADGRIINAATALEHRLVDQVGYWADALEALQNMLGRKALRIVRYERRFSFTEWLATMQGPSAWMRWAAGPRVLYLWEP